ncbi:hypothetical protein ACT7C7_05570 [Bacillus cereus]
MQHLRNTALPINKVSKLVDELSQGEACFIENSDRILEVRIKLGLDNENVNQKGNSKKRMLVLEIPKEIK